MPRLSVKKINKRLWIVDENDNKVYTYPNFICPRTRADLENLMVDLEEGRPYVDAVMAWETWMRSTK